MSASSNQPDLPPGVIVLVGAGGAALDRLNLLRAGGRDVRWFPVSDDVGEEVVLINVWRRGQFRIRLDDPRTADLVGVGAVVSAAGGDLDVAMAQRAQAIGIPVHVVGRPDLSTVGFPDDPGGTSRPSWFAALTGRWPWRSRNPNSIPCQEAS